jgi:quercetin dioxygenase-like cupin family protein
VGPFGDLARLFPQRLAPGYLARAVHGERLTLAVVEVEPGAELPEHGHDNEQLGIVIEGSLTFHVGGETRTLEAGGTWTIPSNTRHRATGGPDGAVVIDVFAPVRTDWREIEAEEPAPPRWP